MEVPADIAQWRTTRRAELLARRTAIASEDRQGWNKSITRLLIDGFPCLQGMILGFCWPFKGEFDARFAVRHFRDRGARAALPVVVAKANPLQFRVWTPETVTTPGVFGLPVPEGTDIVRPDALLIPPIGFGSRGYRLGYGGGYFDRTLTSMTPQPLKIGVAFEICRLQTIYPQPHDIPMDFIVTEKGIHQVTADGLVRIHDPRRVRTIVAQLSRERERATETTPAGGRAPAQSLSRRELLTLLNTLLEAERASAKALAAHLGDYEVNSVPWLELIHVQRDKTRNCAMLIGLIQGLGETPSAATGPLLDKALAVQGAAERLALLNRGQEWVARTIREVLPQLADPVIRPALRRMLTSHAADIQRCGALLQPQR